MATLIRKTDKNTAVIAEAINDLKKFSPASALASDTSTDIAASSSAATAQSDAAITAVADAATAAGEAPDDDEFDAVVELANDLKAKYNASVALTNDLKAKYNAAVTLINELKTDFNALRATVTDLRTKSATPGSYFHLDKSERTIELDDADDLDSALALVNQIMAVYSFHVRDTLAHKAKGVALASTVPAHNLTQAMARANDIKSKYGTHRASTTYHYAADSTNTISSPDATDLDTLLDLVNELKEEINDHMADGPEAKSLRVIPA